MKNCIVAQSGGPTAAINASLAGVVKGVMASGHYGKLYGALNGITGILNERYLNLTEIFGDQPELLSTLIHTPAMYLGSCRFKLPDYRDDDSDYVYIFNQFKKYDIGAFFYIGGNDSMDTVKKLSEYAALIKSDVRVIGVPKTIDNDLMVTDHTPGFGSAAKYIATSILEMAHDTFIYAVKSVTIVEIMGRDAGWLTASSALARNDYNEAPHLIYLPETAFSIDQFIEELQAQLAVRNNVIVAVSEGIRDAAGDYISASSQSVDNFGHSQLSGAGKTLEFIVKERLGVKVRSVEVNVLQRCAAHMASKTDLTEASSEGQYAVTLAEQGKTGVMVTILRTSDKPYETELSDVEITTIANAVKEVPREWINAEGNDVTEQMLTYLRPLIMGEVKQSYENGMPVFMDVSHLRKADQK